MFTGLVVERGRVIGVPQPSARGGVVLHLGYTAELAARLEVGASLAVDGVCLTVVEQCDTVGTVELSPETLARTRLGECRDGTTVNLEPALRLGDPLGGHWVQGHVDGLSTVVARRDLGSDTGHRLLTFALAAEYRDLMVEKGSVAVDGVSLTIAELNGPPGREEGFTVALVPHTLRETTLGERRVGDRVHLELDILGKYIRRQIVVAGAGVRTEPGAPSR